MTDEFDTIEPGRRSGAHRQDSASSNVGAITLVIVLALVAVLLVVAAINIITSSMRDPETTVGEGAGAPATSAPATPKPSESEVSVVDSSLKVDVLNGSGVSGVAKKFSDAVEKAGWTIGKVGNYSTARSDSVVYYRDKDSAAQAKLVADALGIKATEQSKDFTADLTVVVCSDIAQRGPKPSGGDAESGGATTGSEGGTSGSSDASGAGGNGLGEG